MFGAPGHFCYINKVIYVMFGPSMGMWGLVRLFNGVPPRVHLLGLACMRPRKAPPSMGPTLGLGPPPPRSRGAKSQTPPAPGWLARQTPPKDFCWECRCSGHTQRSAVKGTRTSANFYENPSDIFLGRSFPVETLLWLHLFIKRDRKIDMSTC